MLESLSPGAAPTAYLAFWILLLVSFLIGWFFSRWYYRGKYQQAVDDCQIEKQKLKKTYEEKIEKIKSSTVPVPVAAAVTDSKQGVNFARVGKADESQKDDLKKISGVGKFIEEKLNKIGIYTYAQISNFTLEDIQTVTDLIEFFPGRIERDNWVGQAKILKEGGSTEFSKKVDNKEVDYDQED